MKKILTLLSLYFCTLLSSAQATNLSIFYINGIQNTPLQASESAKSLQTVLSSLIGGTKVEVIYNPIGFYGGALKPDADSSEGCITFVESTGQFILHTIDKSPALATFALITSVVSNSSREFTGCLAADLGELAASKINEENYAATYADSFIVGRSSADFSAKYATGMKAKAAAFVNSYFPNEKPSVRTPVLDTFNKVTKAVRSGNNVLVVAHSQGNLIANMAWVKMLATLTEAELQKIRILNVANTSRFSPHGADITHDADFEIKRLLVGLGLSHTRNTAECAASKCSFKVGAPTYATGLNALTTNVNSWDNHNFVAAYLSGSAIKRTSDNAYTTFANAMNTQVDTLLQSLPAHNTPPTASFMPNFVSGSTSTEFRFLITTSNDSDGFIVNYAWNFGDGATFTGTQATQAAHTYAAPGQYTVTLTVTDNQGATGKDAVQVVVTATPQPDLIPSAVTTTPASVQPGASVNVSWRITNSGNANAAASTTGLRLVSAATSGNGTAANHLMNVPTGALAVGGVANQSQAITIPAGTAPGSYVVVIVADNTANSGLGQSNTTNDYARSIAFNVGSADVSNAPSVPTLSSPGLGTSPGTSLQSYNSVAFTWNASNNAANYALRIYDNSGVERGLFYSSGTSATQNLSSLSLYGYAFYWRLSACNSFGQCSAESSPLYFQFPVPVNPPSQPSGLSPQGFPLASTLALSWSQVANATYYQWEISGTGLQSAVTSTYWPGNTTTSLNLTPVGSYLWQVRACNSAGCSSYALASFATPPPTLPSSPTGLTPGATIQNNAQTLTGTDVSLQWSSVVGVNFYNIKLVNVTTGQAIHNPVAVNASNSYFNAQNLAAGLYYWEIAACIDTTTCSVFTNAVYFRLQNSVSSPVISVTSLSQTVFDLRGQNYGSPSGNAYIPTLAIYGSALDTANQITWSWSGATSGSAIWTKSVSGSWANASGAARTVSLLSSSQINASPALIAVGDTWRGTVNWSVQVCSGTNSCSSANFSVLR